MYKKIILNDINTYLLSKNIQVKVDLSYSSFGDYHYQSALLFQLKKDNNFDSQSLIDNLKSTGNYLDVAITGKGFLSFKLKLTNIPINLETDKQTVIVDYCGVNVAKKMHIGHIRSMFIGDFIVRSHLSKGDNVISYNHIGDWGNQFGFLLHYIQKENLVNDLDNKKLTEYYKISYELYNVSKENKNDDFHKKADQVAFDLQNYKDDEIHSLWKKCVDISLLDLEETLKEFNLKMQISDTKGESFYAQFGNDIINDLINQNLAIVDVDNSVYVPLKNDKKIVLKKSNGNFLYALYDLAAIKWRVENHNPDKIIYVVDKRQSLHFDTVFEIAKQAGYAKPHTNLIHLGFGMILGENNKPIKTKEGESLYLSDLLEQGKSVLSKSSHFDKFKEPLKSEILNKTIIGGLKFYDLKFTKHQDYLFDWNHVLNFTGGSAPYIQNAYVRIDSILFKKYGFKEPCLNECDYSSFSSIENDLFFNSMKTYELINEMTKEYQSQSLTSHLVALCSLFHKYYESEKILGHLEEGKKLFLIDSVKSAIVKGTEILGIETYPCISRITALKD